MTPAQLSQKTRLNTWKEVGAFFGKSERTVKRWESERGLPIHRLPGEARSVIYAEVAELETWLQGAGEDVVEARPVAMKPMPRLWLYGLVALALVVTAALLLPRLLHRDAPVPPEARALYLRGMADWQARTPDSLTRAVDEFNAAIRIAPGYAQAYAGLANTYNLMREYTAMPAGQAFPLAKAAAEHAIRLDDRIASAHAALAFADFFGFWDYQAAQREYSRALELDPDDANAEHWYATFLLSAGDIKGAMTHIDHALALNPDSISAQADRGMIQAFISVPQAKATLTALEADHPDFTSPHLYLGRIAYIEGNDTAFVQELQTTAKLTGDASGAAVASAAEHGLKSGGREDMLRAMLAVRLDQFRHGAAGAYSVAALYAQLRDAPDALAYVKLAVDRREFDVIDLKTDPRFDPVRSAPGFGDQVARLHP